MRFIKLFIVSVIVLVLMLLAFSSLLPSKVRISRAININDSSGKILSRIEDMKEWPLWNEYLKAVPLRVVVTDSITSEQLTVSIINIGTSTVNTRWTQKNGKSFPGVFNLIPHQAVTTVQWYFEISIKWYPWEKFGSIIYDNQLGPQMEKSLLNLKQLIEKAP